MKTFPPRDRKPPLKLVDKAAAEAMPFTTGRLRYSSTTGDSGGALGGATLRAGGEILLRTDTTTPYIQALGRTPSRRSELPAAHEQSDATSRYGVDTLAIVGGPKASDNGGYVEPTLTDLRTGRSYHTRIPTSGEASAAYSGVAVAPRTDGSVTVLVPVGTALMAVHAEQAGNQRFQENYATRKYAMSPDGHFIALATDRRLEVIDASRTRHQWVSLSPPAEEAHWIPTWTADSKRIVVWGKGGNLNRSYSVQDLSDSMPLDNIVPGAKALDTVTELQGSEVDSVAALQGSEIVVLTVAGRLARIDAADATVRTQLFLVHPAPNWAGLGASDEIFVRGQVLARPGHPGQVAAVTRTGSLRGEILLWDVRTARRITTLSGQPISVPDSTNSFPSALAFTTDGSHLAVQHTDEQIRVWDVGHKKQSPHNVPFPGGTLVGAGPGDRILTFLPDRKQIRIHDLTDGGDALATLPVPDGDRIGGFIRGHHLTIENGSLRQTIDLRPDTQFNTLCAAAGRDYTSAERNLLPEGTPSKPPCA
ncbi:WD40 repeat domain-containing protein [Streptomyces echinatus]|uniref:WD40 repeat domain-containing protein n=1 Tax=Streptomyces echinatus TaxID=67293 RepID=UPI003793DB9A